MHLAARPTFSQCATPLFARARRRAGGRLTVSLALAVLGFAAPEHSSRGAELDNRPLDVAVVRRFEQVKWTGWNTGESEGIVRPLRPILLTHAGDGSGRTFVPTQQGRIHILPPSGKGPTTVFFEMESLVAYDDKTNEEGFLGLAFHPRHRENGELFIYYTNRSKPHQNVVARLRVDPKNRDRVDPASHEVMLVLDKPYWNHDGGTICFGSDGMLYIAVGDGGLARDPHGNGQNRKTLLGDILRIDVDHRQPGLAYAIPSDNPFVNDPEARGEIWAYGLRNVWRMAFDRKTGTLWAGDVGQDLWEEIDLIERGGNYGWNLREAMHPFGEKGSEAGPELIEPIWEYSHDIGKSITGGLVYRGKAVPELDGAYLYADYVSTKLWGLWYDDEAGRVTANREILWAGEPVVSFGEDESGEAFMLTISPSRGSIWSFAPAAK